MSNRLLLALALGLSLGTVACGDLTRPTDLRVSKDRASLAPTPQALKVAEAAGVQRPPGNAVRFKGAVDSSGAPIAAGAAAGAPRRGG
jgi:hypothetical protein